LAISACSETGCGGGAVGEPGSAGLDVTVGAGDS
jgi:hypothetical protein